MFRWLLQPNDLENQFIFNCGEKNGQLFNYAKGIKNAIFRAFYLILNNLYAFELTVQES